MVILLSRGGSLSLSRANWRRIPRWHDHGKIGLAVCQEGDDVFVPAVNGLSDGATRSDGLQRSVSRAPLTKVGN